MIKGRFFKNVLIFSVSVLFLFSSCDGTKRVITKNDNERTGDSDVEDTNDSDEISDSFTENENDVENDEDAVYSICGNNIVEGKELCDGNVKDCKEIDPVEYIAGKAKCSEDCNSWDTLTCEENPYECGMI